MVRPTNRQAQQREALRAQGRKWCGHCKRILPLEQFGKNVSQWDGLQSSCRPCMNQQLKTSEQRLRLRLGEAAYLEQHNRQIRAARQRAIARVGVYAYNRKNNLRVYGLTPDEYDAISLKQDGRCASCGEVPPPHSRSRYRLEVDHDHKTHKTRELLCHGCNLGLGAFADSPKKLRAAIRYLRKHHIS